MPIITLTDGESLVVLVGDVINQFNFGSKLVGITSEGVTNLERFKAILDSTSENTGGFDLKIIWLLWSALHVSLLMSVSQE